MIHLPQYQVIRSSSRLEKLPLHPSRAQSSLGLGQGRSTHHIHPTPPPTIIRERTHPAEFIRLPRHYKILVNLLLWLQLDLSLSLRQGWRREVCLTREVERKKTCSSGTRNGSGNSFSITVGLSVAFVLPHKPLPPLHHRWTIHMVSGNADHK